MLTWPVGRVYHRGMTYFIDNGGYEDWCEEEGLDPDLNYWDEYQDYCVSRDEERMIDAYEDARMGW